MAQGKTVGIRTRRAALVPVVTPPTVKHMPLANDKALPKGAKPTPEPKGIGKEPKGMLDRAVKAAKKGLGNRA